MATVFDVATYILEKMPNITAMKLQKLVYYSQAWHSVWSDSLLFQNRIEAWANGPVSPDLYNKHRGLFTLDATHDFGGLSSKLSDDEKDSIDRVIGAYGDKSSQWLSELTHMEEPWVNARADVRSGDRCSHEITVASMSEYYSAL